jgi:hypothetical protein
MRSLQQPQRAMIATSGHATTMQRMPPYGPPPGYWPMKPSPAVGNRPPGYAPVKPAAYPHAYPQSCPQQR